VENAFLDLASESGTSFQLGEVVVPAVSALRSPDVARDLIGLGAITLNAASPGVFDKTDASDGASLMAVLFDYAIEVAPRTPGEESTIDVAGLGAHVSYMRETFGDIEISPELITMIGQHAQMRINLETLAARQDPQNQAD